MSATLANEIRPANMPIYCSACRGQDSSLRHIDFDAACDRGYGQPAEGFKFGTRMDFLILCENCVKDGAGKLDMIEAEAWKKERESLQARLEDAEMRAKERELYAENLEETLRLRPAPTESLCECGCGETVTQGKRFRQGHHLRKREAVVA